jgi:DNA adenine methylase
MDFYSPLRYPGGKAKIADYFKRIFTANFLCDGVYVEPYAGGASVALSLLFNEYVSRIVINDINPSIFAFWYSVLNKPDELCRLIRDTPVTIATWEEQKAIYQKYNKFSLLEVGFSTFFLNRTNHSGILSAGVIGGKKQKGSWRIDARFNKRDLINRIERIAAYRDKIELYNSDAIKLIKSLRKNLPPKTLFYLDPPYYVKGRDLYINYYADKDHYEIATEISKVKKQRWIVTYDHVPFITQLYKNYRQVKYTLNYSAGYVGLGQEVMIFSDNLHISASKTGTLSTRH